MRRDARKLNIYFLLQVHAISKVIDNPEYLKLADDHVSCQFQIFRVSRIIAVVGPPVVHVQPKGIAIIPRPASSWLMHSLDTALLS